MKNKISSLMQKTRGVACALAVTLGAASTANADLIEFDLDAEVINGILAGEMGSLSFEIDDILFSNGANVFNPATGLESFELEIFGQMFEAENDINFDSFPSVSIFQTETGQDTFSRMVTGIDLIISELFPGNPTDIDDPNVLAFFSFEVIDDVAQVEVAYPEPVPAPLPIALMGLGLLAIFRKARRYG